MGIFSSIMDKLRSGPLGGFGKDREKPAQQTQYQPPAGQQGTTAARQPQTPPPVPTGQVVDIEAVMAQYAKQKGGGGNWRESIVDLLKMLDIDSSLEARKELAKELGVNAGAHGSAEQNIALHKAVMRKVAENGGKVPDSLKD
jgi:hypothetical protein